MENPHEQTHNALLSRIINNMVCGHLMNARKQKNRLTNYVKQENLNESVVAVNKSLQHINNNNLQTEILAQMWENYIGNSKYNLEVTGLRKEPLSQTREENSSQRFTMRDNSQDTAP